MQLVCLIERRREIIVSYSGPNMKKILYIILIIILLASLSGCDNYKQYPSDNATRYPTLEEALETTSDKIKYVFEEGNIVYVVFGGNNTTGLFLYKDEVGYVKSSEFNNHTWAKKVINEQRTGSGLLSRMHYADKYIIKFSMLVEATYEPIIYDSLNSEFQYKEYVFVNSNGIRIKTFDYFLVMDEIPKDYKVYIDGVEYGINQLVNSDIEMIVVFGLLFTIPLFFIIRGIVKKSKNKKKQQKMDEIWGT